MFLRDHARISVAVAGDARGRGRGGGVPPSRRKATWIVHPCTSLSSNTVEASFKGFEEETRRCNEDGIPSGSKIFDLMVVIESCGVALMVYVWPATGLMNSCSIVFSVWLALPSISASLEINRISSRFSESLWVQLWIKLAYLLDITVKFLSLISRWADRTERSWSCRLNSASI